MKKMIRASEYGDVERLMINYDDDGHIFIAEGDMIRVEGTTLKDLLANVRSEADDADEIIDKIDWLKKDVKDPFEDYGEIVVVWY